MSGVPLCSRWQAAAARRQLLPVSIMLPNAGFITLTHARHLTDLAGHQTSNCPAPLLSSSAVQLHMGLLA